jgi:hypothetical protein
MSTEGSRTLVRDRLKALGISLRPPAPIAGA